MSRLFAILLFIGVLYETSANVPHHQRHRHHRQNDAASCINTLCSDVPYYPFTGINDAVNEVRQLLTTHPIDENRLKQLDPEVYNFHSEPNDVDIKTLPEDVGDCKTEIQEFDPQEGHSSGQNFFIVNIPSLRQSILSVRCNCRKSVHYRKCGQAYREERLLSLPVHKTYFNIKDFSIQTYMIPYGCAC